MSGNNDHDQGQIDASNGEYDPPIGSVEAFFTWSSSGMDEIIERNGNYDAGHKHATKQK